MYELWFRVAYKSDIQEHGFTSAVRPGNRLPGNPKGVAVGEEVRIRILKQPGTDNASPVFDEYECRVQITEVDVLKLADLTSRQLRHCSADARDPQLLKYHLGLIYNRMFSDDEDITLVSWKYL